MIKISFGDVRNKNILTPNHFISHMIEHIAWRMGLCIELKWDIQDWKGLGNYLGAEIAKFTVSSQKAGSFGMIDDGSAIVTIALKAEGNVSWEACGDVDLEWFFRCRCEQLESGKALVELAEGLSEGLGASIFIRIWSLEDPHHTWEGIYRGIGICLSKVFTQEALFDGFKDGRCIKSKVQRGTAESGITVQIDFEEKAGVDLNLAVDESIADTVKDAQKILQCFAQNLEAQIAIDFKALQLSSSHVVMEDIGIVMGRALLEILKERMEMHGVNGAGSNIGNGLSNNVNVGVSVEGRKFWQLIPWDGDYKRFKKDFLVGQNVLNGLRSEDLDDFIDGLSGGMQASIMIHVNDYADPSFTWMEIFSGLGTALKETFQFNPYRKGVPPGVKATLL